MVGVEIIWELHTLIVMNSWSYICWLLTGFLLGGAFVNKSFNDTINGKLCLCKNSPRFHQIASNKRSKINISRGSIPPDPLSLSHALHTDTYLLPPNNPYNLILPPPLGKKLKETLPPQVPFPSLRNTLSPLSGETQHGHVCTFSELKLVPDNLLFMFVRS